MAFLHIGLYAHRIVEHAGRQAIGKATFDETDPGFEFFTWLMELREQLADRLSENDAHVLIGRYTQEAYAAFLASTDPDDLATIWTGKVHPGDEDEDRDERSDWERKCDYEADKADDDRHEPAEAFEA